LDSEICTLSAVALAALIKSRALSVREVTTAFLDRIDALNPIYNAIVSLRGRGDILAEADQQDQALASGMAPGPLFGLPIAIKDLAMTKGLRTSFGSPIFANFVPDQDDLFVARIRQAGAIIIGKTNVAEFGLGSQTYNNVFGATRNAYNPTLTAGGSSGGAAVALALRLVPIADGSDMGGSLRNPAAFNNVFGFRPSQGRVPAFPTTESFMTQLATEGPMGRSVADLALLLSVLAGRDDRVPLSLAGTGEAFRGDLTHSVVGQRIGWLGDLGGALPMEPGILQLCETGLSKFSELGCDVKPIALDFNFEKLWQAFVTLRHFSTGLSR
jgi:amidase